VGKIAGLYSSEALGRAAEQDLSKLEGRSLKSAIWKVFAFHLFRVALFFGAAYSNYSKSPGTAWLLGIILVYSFLDPQFFMKPNLMTAYLAFTVIFYYSRWVMQWGMQATTVYGADAPNWVRVIKDLVWVGVFAVFGFRALTRPKFSRNMPLWFTPRGMIMVLLMVIFLALPFLSFFYARGGLFDVVLIDFRLPLEYVPIVFIFPFVLRGESSIKYLRAFVPLILLTLLFLGVEMFSGRRTGMDYGGIYVRYGSIFGSPNDFGVFMMLSTTAVLAFLAERATKWSHKAIALLVLMLCAVASTVSLSAIFSMVFTSIALILFSRNRVKGALTVLAAVVLVAGLYFAFPQVGVSRLIGERLGNLATLHEGSARSHYTSVVIAEDEISRFEPAEYLLGTFQSRNDLSLPETYYLRTFFVRGAISLLVILSMIGLTGFEGFRRYRAAAGDRQRRALFLAAFLGVAGFAFASLFISYFESFPSNFYFWFLVAIIWCEPMSERELYAVHAVRPKQQIVGEKTQRLAPGIGQS
jgi:hypothetical protein